MERLTQPNPDYRTRFIVLTARAIVLRNPNAQASDEACVVRALCAMELNGLNEFFTLAPRSVGMVRAEIMETIKLIRQGLL